MATIRKRGNSYLFRCYDGYNAAGRQIERTMTWNIPDGMSDKKAEKEAHRLAALFEEKVRTGNVAEKKIKFAAFAEKWFADYAEQQLRPRTTARYKTLMVRINPAIGHIYLDMLRPGHLAEFYKELGEVQKATSYAIAKDLKTLLKKQGITKKQLSEISNVSETTLTSVIGGKNISPDTAQKIADALQINIKKLFRPASWPEPLSGKTILQYHRLISSILQTAVYWQYIPANPAERVKPPKVKKEEAPYLDDKQAIRLLELMEDQPIQYRTAVAILLFTGMRRGELLGLNWNDVNFENMTIDIQRTLQYLPEKGTYIEDTKTISSRRVIKAATSAIEYLKEFQQWQRKEFFKLGINWNINNPIFLSINGTPMHPDTLTGWFREFIKTTDLPEIHIHSLRHTNATLLIANGVSLTTVAGNLGHSNSNTTTQVYAHAIQSAAAASAEMLDNLLQPVRKNA